MLDHEETLKPICDTSKVEEKRKRRQGGRKGKRKKGERKDKLCYTSQRTLPKRSKAVYDYGT